MLKTQSALANEEEKDRKSNRYIGQSYGWTVHQKKYLQIANTFMKRCLKTKKNTKNSQNVQIKIMRYIFYW